MLRSCIIYAKGESDLAGINIPNDLIKTETEHEKDMDIINIRGILVDMLLDIALDVYGPYGTIESKGIKKLITQGMNTIYVTMVASILYYCKFLRC